MLSSFLFHKPKPIVRGRSSPVKTDVSNAVQSGLSEFGGGSGWTAVGTESRSRTIPV